MKADRALELIRKVEPSLRGFGAVALYLFGSTARGEATAKFDIDIFIDQDPTKPFDLMQLTGIEFLLEDTLGTEIDLCTRSALHPALRTQIEQTAIRVF